MNREMTITTNDYQRLIGLIEFTSVKTKMPEIVARLHEGLTNATMLSPQTISESVITMNSRVELKDTSTGRETELTITYPEDADNRKRKVSIFSAIGIALLGKQVGELVSWKVPTGVGQFEILKVTYQPEAEGHYSL